MERIKFYVVYRWETILEAQKTFADVISHQQRADLARFLLKMANIKINDDDVINFDGPRCRVYIGDYRVIESEEDNVFLLQREIPIFNKGWT